MNAHTPRTLICFDVDGVLNFFTKNPREAVGRTEINTFPVQWRLSIIDRVKSLAARKDVETCWLTSWLSEPWMLDQLEQETGLHLETRGEHPWRSDLFTEPVGGNHLRSDWWKYQAFEMLCDDRPHARACWVDDYLMPRGFNRTYNPRTPTHERLYIRTNSIPGLLPEHLDRLEKWLDAEAPTK